MSTIIFLAEIRGIVATIAQTRTDIFYTAIVYELHPLCVPC